MIARVVRSKGPTGAVPERGRGIQERALPALREVPGFRGAYWLLDSQVGEGIAVLLWDNEEAARAGEEKVRPIREELMGQSGVTMEGMRDYEVIAHS